MAYVGQGIKGGTFSVLDTSGNTYNGSNVTFNLGTQVSSPAQLLVSHDGVIQKPVTDYTIATGGTQITFTTAPASGASIFITEISGAVGAPMNRDINGDELILDADADTSITADTDDQIDIRIAGADDFQFTANTFTAQAGSTITTPTLGVITAKDLGAGIHIRTSDTGASVHANADEFVIEQEGNAGMTILSADASTGSIMFGDSGSNVDGGVTYDHNGQEMAFQTGGGGEVFRLSNDGQLSTRGETAPDVNNGGLCLNHGGDDAFVLTLKNSDVAHGITGHSETDTYATFRKIDNADGGLQLHGLGEANQALRLNGICATVNTAKSNASSTVAPIILEAALKSGTGSGDVSADGNLLVVKMNGGSRFIVDEDGDIHYDGSDAGAFDTYDDAQLVRSLDLSRDKNLAGVIDSKFDDYVKYNHETLANAKLVGREEDGTPNHFINITGMQRLHNGAIWQQYEKHNQLLEAVYDLAKEAVGEDKANAILDKHEVKRLQ